MQGKQLSQVTLLYETSTTNMQVTEKIQQKGGVGAASMVGSTNTQSKYEEMRLQYEVVSAEKAKLQEEIREMLL